MHMTIEKLMSRAGFDEVKAIDFLNQLRNSAIENGEKCVRVIRDGKVVSVTVGEMPKSKYKVKA